MLTHFHLAVHTTVSLKQLVAIETMIYGGEPLHGNNPSDWETVSILRSDRLGLYGDGLEDVYDKNLKACEYAEVQASTLYDALYPIADAANAAQRRLARENAYRKMIRIKQNLNN